MGAQGASPPKMALSGPGRAVPKCLWDWMEDESIKKVGAVF